MDGENEESIHPFWWMLVFMLFVTLGADDVQYVFGQLLRLCGF